MVDAVSRPMRALNPSLEEFIALTAFLLWVHPGHSYCSRNAFKGEVGVSESTLKQCEIARTVVFDQLHDHYESMGRSSYASRLAQLMACILAVQVCGLLGRNLQQSVAQRREDLLIVELCGIPDEKYSSLVELFRT